MFLNDTLPNLLKKYDPKNVYNGDETGIYWRGLPSKGYWADDKS